MRVLRQGTMLVLLAAAIAAVAASNDFWRTKPYTSWSAKEVHKVLWSSPWAGIARTPYYPPEEYGGPPEQVKTFPPGNPRDPDTQMDPLAPPSAIKETYHPEGAYVVRWASSKTVQHAMLRDAELHGSGNSSAEERLPSPPSGDYKIVVQSANPSPLPWLNRENVKESACLRADSTGAEIAAERVDVVREEKTARSRVIFYFPKKTASGKPLITAADGVVEFFAKFGPAALRAKFDLHEMVGQQGPDY
jgi:hypothetical protein